jgi:hypothetical protein
LLGLSRTVHNGRTVAFEFLRIHQDEKGIVLTAHPSGQKEASFRLNQFLDGSVTFENLEHDFPHRIVYLRNGNQKLLGRIEGRRNGKERAIDFPMTRRLCQHD